MKKFVYLCGMMLLSMNMMAQIDLNDRNWKPIVVDDFDEQGRYFDNSFRDSEGKWIAFCPRLYPSGVTTPNRHNIFQYDHCTISGGYLYINSEFIHDTPITCNEQTNYVIPPPCFGRSFWCDSDLDYLYYHSGMIESLPIVDTNHVGNWPPLYGQFRYGFFEIRCQIPVHEGSKTAFWLWDAQTDEYYEEIDVFEFSWGFEDPYAYWHHNPHPHGAGHPKCFTSGLYFNDESSNLDVNTMSQGREYLMIDDSLSHWHTFSCEWMPDHIYWYCDGEMVDRYENPDSIPSHPMTLKTFYKIDRYAMDNDELYGNPQWIEGGSMVIDYINVYQLEWDCDRDELITCQTDLTSFDYKVKKSIAITSTNGDVSVGSSNKVTFRTSGFFEITGPFQVDSGGELTVIMQSCPE